MRCLTSSPAACLAAAVAACGLAMAGITPAARAQTFSGSELELFRQWQAQPRELARYHYLLNTLPRLPDDTRLAAMQLFASSENELGLYNEALRDFPLKSHVAADTTLPTPDRWVAASAVDEVTRLAADRRIVMVNEAHHDAHTRQLTLALLPRLRALGYTHFAAEALSGTDAELMRRGYPVIRSGSTYLREPLYGAIIREAIRLGYVLVPYDTGPSGGETREVAQANTLYREVFAKNPAARLFLHAGYAHIDKATGRLGNLRPMAMHLQELTHSNPLSIDQTEFREQIPGEPDAYSALVKAFHPTGPTVLLNRATRQPWASRPARNDASVILPSSGSGALESGFAQPSTIVHDTVRSQPMLARYVNTQRPAWLRLDGQRRTYDISTALCRTKLPCVVDAHYYGEPDQGVAADRYAFLQPDAAARLYLWPGRYRLRASDRHGITLSEQTIEVDPR